MNINVTDQLITLEEGNLSFSLLQKPSAPDYSNVTVRPLITFYYITDESIWDRFSFCMQRLGELCAGDPYLGCYALVFRRLYPVLLSDSRAKNIISYGLPADCDVHKVFQDFMTFLQMGNALTALPQSPFCFTAFAEGVCHALVYNLDACGALQAVCDGISKVRPGGTILLYTLRSNPPAELAQLLAAADTETFGSSTVYALSVDNSLTDYARCSNSQAPVFSQTEALLARVNETARMTQAMSDPDSCPTDAYPYAIELLRQTEILLLSLYDFLQDAELPVRANALKEAIMNYYIGVVKHYDLHTYADRLRQTAQDFYAAVEKEFQESNTPPQAAGHHV